MFSVAAESSQEGKRVAKFSIGDQVFVWAEIFTVIGVKSGKYQIQARDGLIKSIPRSMAQEVPAWRK
ncbi:hypothetical protein UFOVP650_75 [uncultured Caudovirales phage]|uniref:Uncharacterized protein n=1 Tax=uncultured Caudovirales phage TaxID=2100421 RepID=A0A6J5ND37_9CAUD|nr:hypothetical protein UFOVP650_75 [uncultured Caudovirales phage]